MRCQFCGAALQPLHDELAIPVCCDEAQNEALYAKPYLEDIALPAKYKPLLQTVVSVIFFALVVVGIALSLAHG
jgi:hypothetical protein